MGKNMTGSLRCMSSRPQVRGAAGHRCSCDIKNIHLLISAINGRQDYPHLTDHLLGKQFLRANLCPLHGVAVCNAFGAGPSARVCSPISHSSASLLHCTPGRGECSLCAAKKNCDKRCVSGTRSCQSCFGNLGV